MATTLDEYELAKRARDGDREALSRLVELSRAPLFAIAYGELHHFEDAQDAVANALLRICRHIGTLRNPEQARPWMARVVRNEARRLRAVAHTPCRAQPPAEAAVGFVALRLDVGRALRDLPIDQARAVALYYLDALPVREIAERLHRPEGTVKYWLSRGRTHLATRMEGYAPMDTRSAALEPAWNAAVVSTEIAPDLLRQMADAMKSAGWDDIRLISDVVAAGTLATPAEGETSEGRRPPAPLVGCRCIVLDEWIGGHSAFEFSTLLRATDEGRAAALFLLIDGNRPEKEAENTAMAAYIAGFDMLLTKPFDIDEFQRFARRIREHLAIG
jgi:RNA polymerase sigma-70 factor (ECF subfamily)